ncbi:bacteriocin biosynthesis protein SagD, partial [Bacillus sp. JJ1521]
MNSIVVIIGEGFLADHVSNELASHFMLIRHPDFDSGISEEADLVLVLHEAWDPSIHQKAEELLRPKGIPWLRGFVSFGEGVVGPLVRPDSPGCS